MRVPPHKSGLVVGATGITVLTGVIWSQISPWWLFLSVPLILSGIGLDNSDN
jgi:hypothetical protein